MKNQRLGKSKLWKELVYNRYIYLMLIPVAIFYIVFKYVPIYGLQLAFKEFAIGSTITESPFNGVENFEYLFNEAEFWTAFGNTLIISFLKIIIGFPIPVLLAIAINEVVFMRFKKISQIVFTFPHFLSWIILSGLAFNLLSSTGAVNSILGSLGFDTVNFLTDTGVFRYVLVFSDIWKEAGWSTIIYIAAITSIDPSIYEAATIDGANRLDKILHIIWPGIRSVVVVMLILRLGQVMSAGFMQVINLYNPAVYSVADILDTYVYRISFETSPQFGVSTAVGLFTGITNCIMLLIADKVAKLFGEKGVM